MEKSYKGKFYATAEVLDPIKDKERLKERQKRIKHFRNVSRDLPNSAFATYYGKPAFENYGMGNNKHPVVGGFLYGHHLLTHNVNPHRNPNSPHFV